MPKKHALLIANTEYRDGKLAPLAHPGLAYAELADALRDPARGAFSRVEVLANANLNHVLSTLDRFFARKPADDILLVYVGGHGFVDAQGEVFLALKESDRSRLNSTALMAAVLGMNMDQCPSPHKLLILDCRFHSPYQEAPDVQTEMKIDPSRVFAGRGLPKLILSAGEASGSAQVKPSVPAATSSTQKLQTVTAKDFTRSLAETLGVLTTVPGSRLAFTVEDWWNKTAADLKAGRAERPVRHAVGDPPLTFIRGASLPYPEFAVSIFPGETPVSKTLLGSEQEMDWNQLSGIFPLDLFAPGQASPPVLPETESGAVLEQPAALEPPMARTLRLEARHGDETIIADSSFTEGAGALPPAGSDRPEGFADLRHRLLAQEEEDQQAKLKSEKEEAVQREKLRLWKTRWQKTLYFPGPDADLSGETVFQPPPVDPTPLAMPDQDGMATLMVSRDQFLNTGLHRVPAEPIPGATIMVPKEEFLGAPAQAAEAPGASPVRPVRGDRRRSQAASSRLSSAGGAGDGRRGTLLLWFLGGLIPLGLALFAFFAARSGLLDIPGLEGTGTSEEITAPEILPVNPSEPEFAIIDPLDELAETPALPSAMVAPAPGKPNTAVPLPRVSAPKARAAVPSVPRAAPKPANPERHSKHRQDSLRQARFIQDSILTARAQGKQDSILQDKLARQYENEVQAEAMAARKAETKARQDSSRMAREAGQAEAFLRKSVNLAFRADAEEMRSLYNRFALGYPGLRGEVVINILVAPDGEIEKGSIHSSTTGIGMFDQLVLGNVMGWKIRPFKARESKSILVAVNFPISGP